MTLGTFRPVLIFPRKYFDTVSEADFASAVAHELAHVRRHDFLLNLIYEVLRLPVSFHPAAFLIKARIDETRELACDEMAAGAHLTRAAYARSLLNIAHSMSSGLNSSNSGCALGLFDTNTLEERTMNLLGENHRISRSRRLVFLAIVLATLATVCIGVSAFSFQVAQPDSVAAEHSGTYVEIMRVVKDTDTADSPDVRPYLAHFKQNLVSHWTIPTSARPPENKVGNTLILLAMLKNGQIAELDLLKSSGDESLDHAAANSIKGSMVSPQHFPPLPDSVDATKPLPVLLLFHYNQKH